MKVDIKGFNSNPKLERKKARRLVENHLREWIKRNLEPDVQLKRINFILKNKERHPQILTEPVVENLEKAKEKLERTKLHNEEVLALGAVGALAGTYGAVMLIAGHFMGILSQAPGYLHASMMFITAGLVGSVGSMISAIIYDLRDN